MKGINRWLNIHNYKHFIFWLHVLSVTCLISYMSYQLHGGECMLVASIHEQADMHLFAVPDGSTAKTLSVSTLVSMETATNDPSPK